MPDMDSMREDFPALWEPMTAIWGRSISTWTLYSQELASRPKDKSETRTTVQLVDQVQHPSSAMTELWVR